MTQRTDDYLGKTAQQTAQTLQVDIQKGLSDAEVQNRRQRYGYNEIQERDEPLWHRVFGS